MVASYHWLFSQVIYDSSLQQPIISRVNLTCLTTVKLQAGEQSIRGEFCFTIIGRADIEARPVIPVVTFLTPLTWDRLAMLSQFVFILKIKIKRFLPFCSTWGICCYWTRLRTPALSFDRCAPWDKLPNWHCIRLWSVLRALKPEDWPWSSGI